MYNGSRGIWSGGPQHQRQVSSSEVSPQSFTLCSAVKNKFPGHGGLEAYYEATTGRLG